MRHITHAALQCIRKNCCIHYPAIPVAFLIILFFLTISNTAANDFNPNPNPNVLILNAYHQGEDWSDNQLKGIKVVLKGKYPFLVPSIEHMDTKRFPSPHHLLVEKQFLKNKYRENHFDLIISLDNLALDFMLKFGDELFPGVPIVFAGVNGYSPDLLEGHKNITGVAEVEDVEGTLNLALKINPDIKKVLAIHDYTSSGFAVHRDMESVAEKFKGIVAIEYAPDGTIDDLVDQLKTLPENVIALLLTYVTDKAGRTFTREESTGLISSASPVPVYAMHETRLGYGIVGGMLLKGVEHGKQVVEIALRILSGEKPGSIQVENSRSLPVFDYNQLVRFKIPIKRLPANSVIINQPVSFWNQYKPVLLPGLIILGFLTATVFILIFSIMRIRRAEEKLIAVTESLNLAIRAAKLGIWDWDIKADNLIWDDGMYRLYGLQRDDFPNVYEAWLNNTHPADRAENDKISGEVRRGEREYDVEFRIIRPDGEIRYIKALGQVIRDSDGVPIRMIGINYDITERKEMEVRIQQSQKMEAIGTLAGGIAHDFNNILSPIIGYTEMMLDDLPEQSALKDKLSEVYAASMRAKELAKQILTFSRQGQHEVQMVSIQHILKEVLKLIRSTIPTTIQIKHNISNDCGIIEADPTQIHQIIMNLTTNAYHAMEKNGGTLSVTLKAIELEDLNLPGFLMNPGHYACLTVADTGTGIQNEIKDKIFEPYFTTKETNKGTGLGLSVVYGIVRKSGGGIQIFSEPGKGTQFHVYLPIADSCSKEQEYQVKKIIQSGFGRILFVDDEESIVRMEKQMLERLGYQVTSRTGSLEALEVFHASPDKFDLVITDFAMPNMAGDKLAMELLKIRPDIPILLCTGFSENMSEEKAFSSGLAGFLMKPFAISDLSQKIRDVLDINKVS